MGAFETTCLWTFETFQTSPHIPHFYPTAQNKVVISAPSFPSPSLSITSQSSFAVELDPLDVSNYKNQPSTSNFLVFPKALPRKTARNATKRKTTGYTDTPEKENVKIQTEERDRKTNTTKIKKNINMEEKKKKNETTKNKNKSSKRTPKTSSSEDKDTDTEIPQSSESGVLVL